MMEGTVMERTMTKSRTTIRPDLRPRRPDLPHLRRAAKNRKSDQSPWIWIWAPPRTPTRARTSSAKNNTPRNTKRRWRKTRAPWRRRSARRLRRRVRRRVAVPAACPSRTPEWFEKFHWFVTPENCLVLSARDAAQADALVTKYLGPDDAYVHADVAGAP